MVTRTTVLLALYTLVLRTDPAQCSSPMLGATRSASPDTRLPGTDLSVTKTLHGGAGLQF
eukprot:5308485-Prymnesium_polylepis.1